MYGCCLFGFGCVVKQETQTVCASTLESPAVCSLAIGGIGSPNTAKPNGGTNWWTHLPGISRLSHTYWKDLFYDLWQFYGRSPALRGWSSKFPKKKDGRTITGTITKRYPKVTRRCLGPPLAQLLAFEALFYNACICLLAVATSLKPATQQWQCGSQNLHLPPTMHVPAVESLLRSHHTARTACSHTLITIKCHSRLGKDRSCHRQSPKAATFWYSWASRWWRLDEGHDVHCLAIVWGTMRDLASKSGAAHADGEGDLDQVHGDVWLCFSGNVQ